MKPVRGLMICHQTPQSYRVLRCFSEARVEVFVLAADQAKGLTHSRFCKQFETSKYPFNGSVLPEMADEINRAVEKFAIDIVFPGCPGSARSFAGLQHLVKAPCFPGPSLELFDLLNNKWEFSKLCKELDILHPETTMYSTKDSFLGAIHSGEITLPRIVKPLDLAGQKGVTMVTDESQIADLDYAPLLVQRIIDGDEIGAGIYCENGEITTFIAHRFAQATYTTFPRSDVRQEIQKIASKFKLNGVYNFDMMVDRDGKVYFLECNPRFFFKMLLARAAGLNFVEPGIVANPSSLPKTVGNTMTRTPRAWPGMMLKPWTITRTDRQMIRTLLGDPVKNIREMLRMDWN